MCVAVFTNFTFDNFYFLQYSKYICRRMKINLLTHENKFVRL